MIFHPLDASTHVLPDRMNNPFYYKPDALCCAAASEVQREIAASAPEFKAEIDQGKMFGVLIVKKGRDIGYLCQQCLIICSQMAISSNTKL